MIKFWSRSVGPRTALAPHLKVVNLISIGRRLVRGLKGELPESLLISLSTVTLALSWPLFNIVRSEPEYLRTPVVPLVTLLMFYQVLPVVAVFALDRLFLNPRLAHFAHRPFRAALFLIALLSFARQAQALYFPGLQLLPLEAKGAIALATVGFVGLLVWKGQKPVAFGYLCLTPLALVVTGLFLASALPLGQEAEAAEVSLARENDRAIDGPVFVLIFDMLGTDILLDEDGEIDGGLFPNFASLAADSAWFPNATANAWLTCNSIPSMLTGKPVHTSLGPCFQREGFEETNVLSRLTGNYRVSTSSIGLSYCYDQDFICAGGATIAADHPWLFPMHFLESMSVHMFPRYTGVGPRVRRNFYLAHRWSVLQFEELLETIENGDASRRLYFHHSGLPHDPFVYDETGNTLPPVGIMWGEGLAETHARVRQQTQYVDLLLGRLIQRLSDLGLYEQATIVVTADHGLPVNIDESSRVVLLIKGPKVEPGVSDVDYQHIDFTNTLFDVLGLPQDPDSEGLSAFATVRPDRQKTFYYSDSKFHVYNRESGTWRLLPNKNGGSQK